MGLTDRILDRAYELGFDRAGVAPADPLPHREHYRSWIEAGHHGEMAWMSRPRDNPRSLLDGCQSIVAVAANYRVEHDPPARGRVARYARGYDYHGVLGHRLEQLAAFIAIEAGADVTTRSAVDTLPLLERDVAYLAGIGWYGKNTMIMNRQLGSHLFLAELLVSAELQVNEDLPTEYCGSCTACLDACPTNAFVAPHVLDARRCISYLTIELRGPIPRSLRPAVGDHLFGCDICQDVCPWNRKSPHTGHFAFLGRPEVLGLTADVVLSMDAKTMRNRLVLSPLQRAKRPGLLRNAAVVLGNSGEREHVPLLARRLGEERLPLVRGHIAWALGQLGGRHAWSALQRAQSREADPYVLEEIRLAMEHAPATDADTTQASSAPGQVT